MASPVAAAGPADNAAISTLQSSRTQRRGDWMHINGKVVDLPNVHVRVCGLFCGFGHCALPAPAPRRSPSAM